MTDHLKQQWACLTCNAKFPVGEVIILARSLVGDPWRCPRCGSTALAIADGGIAETAEYHGEIGTKQ